MFRAMVRTGLHNGLGDARVNKTKTCRIDVITLFPIYFMQQLPSSCMHKLYPLLY